MDISSGNVGIASASAILIGTLIGRLNGIITDQHLLTALVIVGATCFSYLFSWAFTDGYKNYMWPKEKWKERKVKQKIYVCSWLSAGAMMMFVGAALLFTTRDPKIWAYASLAWVALSFFVGVTSSWLWRFVFDNALPRFARWVRGKKLAITRKPGETD